MDKVILVLIVIGLILTIIHAAKHGLKADNQKKGASRRRYEETERLEESLKRRRK